MVGEAVDEASDAAEVNRDVADEMREVPSLVAVAIDIHQ